jgi:hypothetical protein
MKVGDIVKPIRNTCNHAYIIGRKYEITAQYVNGGGGPIYWSLRDVENGTVNGTYIAEADLALFSLNRKEIENKIKEMEIEIDKNKKMIEYLETENKDEVDSNEFFAWYIVRIMESEDPRRKERVSKLLNSISNNINFDQIISR